jgi:hypothetical protein
LKDGAKSADQLAALTKSHPRTLYRVLRALASVNVFSGRRREVLAHAGRRAA